MFDRIFACLTRRRQSADMKSGQDYSSLVEDAAHNRVDDKRKTVDQIEAILKESGISLVQFRKDVEDRKELIRLNAIVAKTEETRDGLKRAEQAIKTLNEQFQRARDDRDRRMLSLHTEQKEAIKRSHACETAKREVCRKFPDSTLAKQIRLIDEKAGLANSVNHLTRNLKNQDENIEQLQAKQKRDIEIRKNKPARRRRPQGPFLPKVEEPSKEIIPLQAEILNARAKRKRIVEQLHEAQGKRKVVARQLVEVT